MTTRTRFVATPALAALTAVALAFPASATTVPIPTSDRAEVESSFVDEVVRALETPIGWTGNAPTCDAGAPSAAAQRATLTTINYVRGLAQLDEVSFDPALSGMAQEAALMMHANDNLDHFPPPSWKCWSEEGAEAARSSNLVLGASGGQGILEYMDDSGGGNEVVGHRRWILRPQTGTFGSGSTSRANALWIFGVDAPGAAVPEWVPWPAPGYFPGPLEPEGRWSLGSSDPDVTFDGAVVTVTDSSGAALPVQTYPVETGFGDNTLVWEVSGVKIPRDSGEAVYAVNVGGIGRSDGGAATFAYEVRLFGPPLTATEAPRITGRKRVGRYVTARAGEWAPDASDFAFQWYRSGAAIDGATEEFYLLRRKDRGDRMTVRVTASAAGYADTSATSAPTRPIRPRS